MRILILVISFLCLTHTAHSQLFSKEKILNDGNSGKGTLDNNLLSWGYFFGFNSYDFNFDYKQNKKDIQVKKGTGFNVGLIGNLRINKFADLRLEPGLYIVTRNILYDESYFDGLEFTDSDLTREVKSTYIHIPLLLKLSTKRLNNFKPFIVVGLSTALNLSSNEKNPDDNSSGTFRIKSNMVFYELGFGVDFYLYWFKFTPSIRGVFAINDELIRDNDPDSPWTNNIETMKTRGLFINFTFQ